MPEETGSHAIWWCKMNNKIVMAEVKNEIKSETLQVTSLEYA